MLQPNRTFSYERYRYGFNGKENENEIKGEGNAIDFGARIYDNRIGKWLSLDPLQKKYPFMSPYNFALSNPILFKDFDGRDIIISASDADNRRIEAVISNAFGAKISAKIIDGKLSLHGSTNTLTPGELILYTNMANLIQAGKSQVLTLKFEDKKDPSSYENSDDFGTGTFFLNIAEARDRPEACRDDIKTGGSSYWFTHFYIEQWGNQIEYVNSPGHEMTTPGHGDVAYNRWNLPKEKHGAGFIGAISGWHEWAENYTMRNFGIGSGAGAMLSIDLSTNDVDLVDGNGYYAGTMRTERILDDKTKTYKLKVSLIDREGMIRGKSKVDINTSGSMYYETNEQWKNRMRNLGLDPSTRSYDDDQRALYFQKNGNKNG